MSGRKVESSMIDKSDAVMGWCKVPSRWGVLFHSIIILYQQQHSKRSMELGGSPERSRVDVSHIAELITPFIHISLSGYCFYLPHTKSHKWTSKDLYSLDRVKQVQR